ncbi:MAG: hypothetical protein IJ280_02535 [Bacteroidales bacterium]|nr:hypothetical protein [Bacteroidales bacterium]
MRLRTYMLGMMLLSMPILCAQSEDFDTFRQRIMNDYQDFRQGILDQYESFLDEAWAGFETFAGESRSEEPKPTAPPVFKPSDVPAVPAPPKVPTVRPVQKPTLPAAPTMPSAPSVPGLPSVPAAPSVPGLPSVPAAPSVPAVPSVPSVPSIPATPSVPAAPSDPLASLPTAPAAPAPVAPATPAAPAPVAPATPATPAVPAPAKPAAPAAPAVPAPAKPAVGGINFELYGLQMNLPELKVKPSLQSGLQKEVVAFWKQIKESSTDAIVKNLKTLSETYRLGAWCTLKAAEQYADIWAKGNANASRVLTQYLMMSLGYDVRMASAGDMVYLLLPFQQQVYGSTFIRIDNNKYYVYPDKMPANTSIYTCRVPADVDCGQDMNLIINPSYLLPKKEKTFKVTHASLSVEGSINQNIIDLQQSYPSMDISCYAASVADDDLRKNIVSQLRQQLAGKPEMEAANALLHFVQEGFEYKTDAQQFGQGVEKCFFFDEVLYFPYCDCEDRSVFFAYLVKEILGLDVLLVGYPGHECTAVALSEAPSKHTSLTYKGKNYYICDPTYMGADVGMCMPKYVNVNPEIEEWY